MNSVKLKVGHPWFKHFRSGDFNVNDIMLKICMRCWMKMIRKLKSNPVNVFPNAYVLWQKFKQ